MVLCALSPAACGWSSHTIPYQCRDNKYPHQYHIPRLLRPCVCILITYLVVSKGAAEPLVTNDKEAPEVQSPDVSNCMRALLVADSVPRLLSNPNADFNYRVCVCASELSQVHAKPTSASNVCWSPPLELRAWACWPG